MTATDCEMVLNACGGEIRQGDECWVSDDKEYTVTKVESAVLICDGSGIKLYHGNRLHYGFAVFSSEEEALKRLAKSAEFAVGYHADQLAKAQRFLEFMAQQEAE